MKYVLKFIPVPDTALKQFLLGVLFLADAQLETIIAGWILPRYYWEIITPVNVGLFLSTTIATIMGAILVGFSAIRFAKWFDKWKQK